MAPTDDLRRELHAVDVRLGKLETAFEHDGRRRDEQHEAVLSAIRDLRQDLSDQGRTPPPPPSLPPGPALPTMVPAERECEPSSDPGALTISPKKLGPWLRLLLPYLVASGIGGGALKACEAVAQQAEPTEEAP